MELKALTALLSRVANFSQLGYQFGTKRDIYAALGYSRQVTYKELSQLYCRQDIAGRVVDAYPAATWQKKPSVKEIDSSTEITEFDTQFKEMAEKTQLWHYLERADKLSGIGEYGVLYIGAPGDVASPLRNMSGPEDIRYLAVYSQDTARIRKLEDNPKNRRFGLPLSYDIDFSASTGSLLSGDLGPKKNLTKSINVHHTRILHVAEGLLQNEIFGQPRLLRVFNLFYDMAKTVGGSGEMFWQGAYRGMQADVDKDMVLDPDDAEALSDEIDEYVDGLRRWVRTRGVKMQAFEATIASPKDTFSVIMSLISGTTGIPQRVLMGSEQGQLASEQDERNWNSRIKERQESYAERRMLRPFIDKCIRYKALPEVKYKVEWPDLMVLNDETLSMVAVRASQAIKNIAESGNTIITVPEFREGYLGLEPENKDLNELPEMADPNNQQTIDDDNEALPKRRDDIDT